MAAQTGAMASKLFVTCEKRRHPPVRELSHIFPVRGSLSSCYISRYAVNLYIPKDESLLNLEGGRMFGDRNAVRCPVREL